MEGRTIERRSRRWDGDGRLGEREENLTPSPLLEKERGEEKPGFPLPCFAANTAGKGDGELGHSPNRLVASLKIMAELVTERKKESKPF